MWWDAWGFTIIALINSLQQGRRFKDYKCCYRTYLLYNLTKIHVRPIPIFNQWCKQPWVHWTCYSLQWKSRVWLEHASTERHGPYVSVETTHTNYDILWSLWKNLAASHRDQSLASGHNCTHLNREVWKVCGRECLNGWMSLSLCVRAWMHAHGW